MLSLALVVQDNVGCKMTQSGAQSWRAMEMMGLVYIDTSSEDSEDRLLHSLDAVQVVLPVHHHPI